jgi:hypothetical protein
MYENLRRSPRRFWKRFTTKAQRIAGKKRARSYRSLLEASALFADFAVCHTEKQFFDSLTFGKL